MSTLSLPTRCTRRLLVWLFQCRPLTIHGQAPKAKRCVIIGAPHTSNWDFIFFVGVTRQLGMTPRFMGKASLFMWPMRRFMLEMGGVPVERSASGNYVEAMVAAAKSHEDFMLVVAPEGTRGGAHKWRSGFYHIAHGAGIPLVPAWVDYGNKCGGLGPEIATTGDYAADMAKIAAFYQSVMPGHPRLAGII